jgi:dUTP pyrophosphatase
MTQHSAGADLKATEAMTIPPGAVAAVPTGVFISGVEWDKVPAGLIPELQIRARSGLAFKKRIMLANGVGTIDADYPEEIKVLLINMGDQPFEISAGDRIAQLVPALVARLELAAAQTEKQRTGGFGSTGVEAASKARI